MGFLTELLLFATYFLLLSTVLQSQDAFVFFQNSQSPPDEQMDRVSRGSKLFIYSVFAMLSYLTLLVIPYVNLDLKKLSIGGCMILLGKYISQLLYYTGHLQGVLQLSAMIFDVVGESVFYLVSLRVIEVLCQRYGITDQSGRMFALFVALYALSIIIGYGIAYLSFQTLPTWTYLIILTSLATLSGVICFFSFKTNGNQSAATVRNQLNEERQQAGPQVEGANRNQNGQGRIYRDDMSLGYIFNLTVTMYRKMLLILPVQITLGIFISFSLNLLEYLVWTTQQATDAVKLIYNIQVILLMGSGALVMSIIVGMVCDYASMKKVGFMVMVFATLVLLCLYFGIAIKTIYVAYLLYLFVGAAIFSMVVWILSACSKIFAGKFQAFSVAAQFVGLSMFFYDMLWILFEGRIQVGLRLGLELGVLVLSGVVSLLFLKKLPSGQFEVEFEESHMDDSQVEGKVELGVIAGEMGVDDKRVQVELVNESPATVDPDLLL